MSKHEFREIGITFKPDLAVRPSDKPALARAWKRATQSDPKDPQVRRMIKAIKARKTASVVIKEVKFKKELQRGLFAAAPIKKGAVVGHYSGKLLRECVVNSDSDYVFSFSDEAYLKWVIDAEKVGNHMRFINHSKKYNLEAVELYYGKLPRIVFIACRNIKKGEELFFNYGTEYWKSKGVKPE